jgi:hypothetical protein
MLRATWHAERRHRITGSVLALNPYPSKTAGCAIRLWGVAVSPSRRCILGSQIGISPDKNISGERA